MKPINVTEPFLPPLEEYIEYLKGIWERNWLTNQGLLVRELENRLQLYHEIETPVHCTANGGLGLQIILKAMGIKGEVITTPFSYVATTSCPLWEGCTVKFADIEPESLTIDPDAVEASMTTATEAILATHVFGNPCDVERLERIGARHGIPVVYDAAHAFGVRYKGGSILAWGDASMVSTHATKLFHTVEGGFVTAADEGVRTRVEWMRRFAHKGYDDFHGVGINAKMSEVHAAMGLCLLPKIESIIERRRELVNAYLDRLSGIAGVVRAFVPREGTDWNAAYFPVVFESEASLETALAALEAMGIIARRYFYPLLSNRSLFPDRVVGNPLPVAESVSRRIACLPLATSMDRTTVERISEILAASA